MTKLDNHSNSIYDAFSDKVISTPKKTALIFESQTLSYLELNNAVESMAAYLAKHQVKTGDFLAVVLPNCIEYVVLLLTAAKLKLVLVPFNIGLPNSTIKTACQKLKIKHFILWHGQVDSFFDGKLIHNDSSIIISVGGKSAHAIDYDSILEKINISNISFEDRYKHSENNTDYPYIICMTSGSTGDPKPIVLSQGTKLKRIRALQSLYRVNENDITLAATPLYHSLAMRLVLQPLVMGGTSVLINGFSVDKWLDALNQHQVTFTIAVSSQLRQIAKHLKNDINNIANLRCLVSSSEQLSDDLKQSLINTLSCEFHECYGTSEIGIATNLDTEEKDHINSVGKAIDNVDIVILDDDKKPLATNQIGEITCKTNMQFSGYLNLPEITNSSFSNGYFLTGDLGYIDDKGYLHYKGRKKELIISGGINIYPKDIEAVIREIPGIKEVAVIAKEDEKLGEVVSAVIVKNPEQDISLRLIKQHCAENLADFQFPKSFIFIDSLPKNSMGKLQKHKLVQMNAG